jgi:hypothetical protein
MKSFLIDTFSSRVFIHDYSKSSKIEAHYRSNGRLYCSYYDVISLGTYPSTPKLTQKSKGHVTQYPKQQRFLNGVLDAKLNIFQTQKYVIKLIGRKGVQNGVLVVQNLLQPLLIHFYRYVICLC